jgi:hypothetical protein
MELYAQEKENLLRTSLKLSGEIPFQENCNRVFLAIESKQFKM